MMERENFILLFSFKEKMEKQRIPWA
jgi:hypothetical protein